jgi:hypothetical protein
VDHIEAVQIFPFLSLLSSLLFSSYWIKAQYTWYPHGYLPPANVGGVSQYAGCAERSPLSCTDWFWDLWVRTIVYVEWLFDYSLSFPFISLPRTGFGSPGRLILTTGIM